jgi:predicted metal-dependent peptidase
MSTSSARAAEELALETKLAAARTRLVLEQPFIAALVMHLPLKRARGWCERIATDARAIYYNPRYIDRLTLEETQFVLAHEALHCALGHFERRGHRTRRRWDVATDYAVNQLLADEGLKAPPEALINAAYRGLAAEDIYPLIPPDTAERTLDQHIADARRAGDAGRNGAAGGGRERNQLTPSGGHPPATEADPESWDDAGNERRPSLGRASLPPALTAREAQALASEWQSRLVVAAHNARRAGRLGAAWLRRLDALLEPRLPWRVLLARYVMSLAREDYSFVRLSRREGAALLPRLVSHELDVCVALDTSGSVSPRELAEFVAELDALKGEVRARVTLFACDAGLDARGPWIFESFEPLVLPPALGGGGGTSFVPVFEWLEREHRRPDVLLYFTDAEGEFPLLAPDYPVLWLVKGRAEVPWGQRMQLN